MSTTKVQVLLSCSLRFDESASTASGPDSDVESLDDFAWRVTTGLDSCRAGSSFAALHGVFATHLAALQVERAQQAAFRVWGSRSDARRHSELLQAVLVATTYAALSAAVAAALQGLTGRGACRVALRAALGGGRELVARERALYEEAKDDIVAKLSRISGRFSTGRSSAGMQREMVGLGADVCAAKREAVEVQVCLAALRDLMRAADAA